MRAFRAALAALLACLSAGCLVAALHPVYDPRLIAFDPSLLGSWSPIEAPEGRTLTFERGEWHSYHVEYVDGEQRVRASARLTRVGRDLLLDVSPLDGVDLPPLTLPIHAIYRVAIEAEQLRLSELDYDTLAGQVRAGMSPIPASLDARGNVVLTATTQELRRWLEEMQKEGSDPFAEPTAYERRQALETAEP
ncbi:MAG TPA: hypothetical protein VF198_13110 [Vicinamibacterales bacterium]